MGLLTGLRSRFSRNWLPAPKRQGTTHIRLNAEQLESREVPAVTIQIDYSYDTGTFFNNNPVAKSVIERAATDLGSILGDSLSPITPNALNHWATTFTSPGDGSSITREDLSIPANTLLVFVGDYNLSESAAARGGPGNASTNQPQSAWDTTVKTRNDVGGSAAWGGTIRFNTSANWYVGMGTSGITPNQVDLYTAALHELGHVLGIGITGVGRWTSYLSGNTFTGPNAVAVHGGPVPLDPSNAHWLNNLVVDGQYVALDPSTVSGARTGFSRLDTAALVDLGWSTQVAAVPAYFPPPTLPPAVAAPASATAAKQGHGQTFAIANNQVLYVYRDGHGWISSGIAAQSFSLGTDSSGRDTAAIIQTNGQLAVWTPESGAFYQTGATPLAGSQVVQFNGKTWYVASSGVLWHYRAGLGNYNSGVGATQFSVGTNQNGIETVAVVQPGTGYLGLYSIDTGGSFTSTGFAPTPGYTLKQGRGYTYFVSSGGLLHYYSSASGSAVNTGIGVIAGSASFTVDQNAQGKDFLAIIQPNYNILFWGPVGVVPSQLAVGATPSYGIAQNGSLTYFVSGGVLHYYVPGVGVTSTQIGAASFDLGADLSGGDKLAVVGTNGHVSVWTPAGFYDDLMT